MTESVTPGLEPRLSLGISHLCVLRGRAVSLLCGRDGELDSTTDASSGLFHRDTRYLSKLTARLGSVRFTGLDCHEHGFWLNSTLTNPDFVAPNGSLIESQSLVLRRQRVVADGVTETLSLTNYGKEPLVAPLCISFAADFEDIFVIRGLVRREPKPPVQVTVDDGGVSFAFTGTDGAHRSLRLDFDPRPSQLSDAEALYALELPPGATENITVSARINHAKPPATAQALIHAGRLAEETWSAGCAGFESSHSRLDDLMRRCLEDLHSLQTPYRDRSFFAAGVPWFDALFGRDALISGLAMLPFASAPLRDALLLLAGEQAAHSDPERDAEPGKIPHELRFGELANTGEVPFGRYYGSVDATPLFIWAVNEYFRWTGDLATVSTLAGPVARAVDWCLSRLDSDLRQLLTYDRQSLDGLEHQGWKDSHGGVSFPDGEAVSPPIALVEVQGYTAAALDAAESLFRILGAPLDPRVAPFLSHLLQVIDRDFFPPSGPALALDGQGKAVPTATSNPGHLLWVGACSQERASQVATRVLQPDLFSGWGVRTLESGVPAFNPLGYHVGSVWPHDNAIILHGLRRYGQHKELCELGSALLEAMLGFPDGRVPELFSGDTRAGLEFPTPFPVASRPQAWAAASLPWVLTSLLGITVESPGSLHVVRPVLPTWLNWARLRSLRFGQSEVDLLFRREGSHTSVEVERQSGPGNVVLAANWPVPPLGVMAR